MYMKNKKAGNCLGMGVSTRGGGGDLLNSPIG